MASMGWEIALDTVHRLAAWTMTANDCWADLRKDPADVAIARTGMLWIGCLQAMSLPAASPKALRGWERDLMAVQDLIELDRRLISCPTDLRNAPADWVMACSASACDDVLEAISLLAVSAMMLRGCSGSLVAVQVLMDWARTPRGWLTDLMKAPVD
jgi:hypothetical protein